MLIRLRGDSASEEAPARSENSRNSDLDVFLVRWGGSNVDLLRTFAKELIGLQPDVLLATSTPTTAASLTERERGNRGFICRRMKLSSPGDALQIGAR
jgi:hypothetical protein